MTSRKDREIRVEALNRAVQMMATGSFHPISSDHYAKSIVNVAKLFENYLKFGKANP